MRVFIYLLQMSALILESPAQIYENNGTNLVKSQKSYLRTVFRLDCVDHIEVPVGKPLERFTDFGILPKSRYDFSVYIEVARLITQCLNPQEIADYLRANYPSLSKARISRVFVKNAIELLTETLMPTLVQNVKEPWVMMIDSTVRLASGDVLLVILGLPVSSINRDKIDFKQSEYFPLTATFIPSENKYDLDNFFEKFVKQLPDQPVAVISDFAKGFLSTLPNHFPNSTQLGCTYHALEIMARILINPHITKLRKVLMPFVKSLRLQSRKIKYRSEINELLIIVETLKRILSKDKGNYGENLVLLTEKLLTLKEWFIENAEIIKGVEILRDSLKIFSSKSWGRVEIQLVQLQTILPYFQEIREFLDTKFWQIDPNDPEKTAKQHFKNLKKKWLKDAKTKELTKLEKAILRFEELFPLLLPALCDPHLPRTTSLLEGVHGHVKVHLRRWNGKQKINSSFDWTAPLLSILHGISNKDEFLDLVYLVNDRNWLKTSQLLSKKRVVTRSNSRISNHIASLDSDGLIRQLNNLLGNVINKGLVKM